MKQIRICDVTMKAEGAALSFREKIELAKLLDSLGVDVMELEAVGQSRTDVLRVKSIATAVSGSILAVPVGLEEDSIQRTWEALKQAKRPRLQVCAPVSSVQMEYLYHKKADAMKEAVVKSIAFCSSLCDEVEFVAQDATRGEAGFLTGMLQAAVEAGATTVTVEDSAGTMLPEEFAAFLQELIQAVPELNKVCLGVCCSNSLFLADACTVAAVAAGAGEIKAAAWGTQSGNLASVARIFSARGASLGAGCSLQVAQAGRILEQINGLFRGDRKRTVSFDGAHQEENDLFLTAHDDMASVLQAVARLGYDLSEEDKGRVYDAFCAIAAKKEKVDIRELEAIVASAAMQVPATYRLETYDIHASNTITSSAHLKLWKDGKILEGICLGDGPIDAAFLAIEQITGRHYELDDFQIQAVTEGREAMGQTIVRLRSEGKLYSGRGISTDIVCASIYAYLNALNKIVYEEEEA